MSGFWFYVYLLAFTGAGITCLLMGLGELGLLFLAWPIIWLGLTMIDITIIQPWLTTAKQWVTQHPMLSIIALVWGALVGECLLLAIDEKEKP